ncbi:MAG: hypothetical protein MUC97_02415 [Bernardetiaceae bacterium]|jgi:hypothetical protein|nr:hypothetical protein [Bernardetiaceae bacterium]
MKSNVVTVLSLILLSFTFTAQAQTASSLLPGTSEPVLLAKKDQPTKRRGKASAKAAAPVAAPEFLPWVDANIEQQNDWEYAQLVMENLETSEQILADELFFDRMVSEMTAKVVAIDQLPQDAGRLLVWEDFDGHDWEIFYFDGKKTHQLTDNQTDDRAPVLSEQGLMWAVVKGKTWQVKRHVFQP